MLVARILAKCSDCCHCTIIKNGEEMHSSTGYVPDFMPYGGGDYINLEIDLNTGQILNWTNIVDYIVDNI